MFRIIEHTYKDIVLKKVDEGWIANRKINKSDAKTLSKGRPHLILPCLAPHLILPGCLARDDQLVQVKQCDPSADNE